METAHFPDSFRVTTNYESDGSYTLKFAIDNPTYTEMPLILGEFFYQLRAALDGAVLTNALARNPAVRETSVEFVIAPDPKEFESKRYKLKFLSPDLQKIMHLLIQRHLPDSARIWAY